MAAILTSFLQRRRLAIVAPYLRGDVLDLGCGDAMLLSRLKAGQTYVGVDGRAPLVSRLRECYPAHQFYQRDLDRQPLELPGRFDTIVLLAVVEHLSRPDWVFAQAAEHLHPGGRLLMTTPSPFGNWVHQVGAHIGLFSLEAMQDHKMIFTQATLSDCLERNGLRVVLYERFLFGGNQLFVCEAC